VQSAPVPHAHPRSATGPAAQVDAWLSDFEHALTTRDVERAAELFGDVSYWRDLIAFTWNITTVEGRDGVRDLLRATLEATGPHGFVASEEPTEADGTTTALIEFETAVGRGRGVVRLRNGRAYTLLTTLYELTGHEEPMSDRRPRGAEHGVRPGRQTWLEQRTTEFAELGRTRQPYVLVVGGGQGGIALAARLRQLDVPTVVVDRNPRPGDAWRNRYKSLCLHDPVWIDHLPYLDFPANWPVFSPKDKIADWLEMYVRIMEINYWGSTTCRRAGYDRATGAWEVVVERDGEELTLRPQHLVLATGMSGRPNIPDVPGRDRFRGDQHHSSEHPGPDAYRGRKAVIIGSNNSAHDIAAALWEVGADVTMVQRSSTLVVRSETLMELAHGRLYSERALAAGITTHKADTLVASMPFRTLPDVQKPIWDAIRERDAGFYARLERAGFLLDFGEDETGLGLKYLRRGSGYYIDVGASELIADGRVRLARGGVRELTEDSVVLTDGTALPADVVVHATGYGSMTGWAAELISQQVADTVGKVWGHGSGTTNDPGPWEGEQRNMWKPTRQEALWFQGGNLAQARYYSLYLALQLKARQVGIPTPVYRLQEVHHRS
jgi:putative flavoprotein involved in K+ transport